ncbi:MAG TPA: hypothetical protein VEF03_04315 [Candidatus Binataceae bacterium]|nr:hypothetical protein [Candidatus Binataceae bacterium]
MRFVVRSARPVAFATALSLAVCAATTARAQTPFFMTSYYDVATSTSPSASGYGGNGNSGGVGDGLLRIVNGGDVAGQQNGTLCAMIYVFDDIEEMQACCGCPVTPDGLRTMSVINNVTKNFGVNRGNLNAGVVDVISTGPDLFLAAPLPLPAQIGTLGASGWACDPSFEYASTIGAGLELLEFEDGLRAWMSHTEGNSPVPATSRNLVKGVSTEEFQFARLDDDHLNQLQNFCFFLIQNGSGTGACSCGSGDSFSKAPSPAT